MPVEISVRNFAMVASADVTLDDLVVLLGPNNSGKSTLATIIYAACHSQPQIMGHRIFFSPGSGQFSRFLLQPIAPEFDRRLLPKAGRELLEVLRFGQDNRAPLREMVVPTSVRQIMRRPIARLLKSYAEVVAGELERCFGDALRDMVMRPAIEDGKLRVGINHGEDWSVNISVSKGRVSHKIELVDLPDEAWSIILEHFIKQRTRSPSVWRQTVNRPVENLLQDFFVATVLFYFLDFPGTAHYLPAARSGMLHSHRALAAALVRQSSFAGIEDVSVPKLPGVITDFIGQLLELSPQTTGAFEEAAAYLEREILKGSVELIPQAPTSPEIRFAAGDSSHALHRTSSLVSELAPVILFLRHVVRPGDLLMIEEPESHLHPASQVKFARALALLLKARARILITTHSDYFLNQVNNLIRRHTLDLANEESDSEKMSIAAEQVKAYLFRPMGLGSAVDELPVDPEDGISDKDFAEVADWLYNESAALVRDINAATP